MSILEVQYWEYTTAVEILRSLIIAQTYIVMVDNVTQIPQAVTGHSGRNFALCIRIINKMVK